MKETLKELLDNLKLRGMANSLDAILKKAEQDGCAIIDVLVELFQSLRDNNFSL